MGGLFFGFRRPLPYHIGTEGWRTALNFYELRDNLRYGLPLVIR